MINLHQHQKEYIDKIRTAMANHKSILCQASCGFGKTVIAAYIAKAAALKGNEVYFTVHRNQLIRQTAKTFDKFDIEHGIIASSYGTNYKHYANNQICSINTLKNRLEKVRVPHVLIVDECHFSVAAGWSKVIDYFRDQGSWIIGLTATPWRMSGDGLEKHFEIMIKGESIEWLINNKYLSTYKVYCPPATNIDNVHVKMGDYVQQELEDALDKKEIVGDVITHWRKFANDKRTLAFAVSVKHSKHIADTFNVNGIPAAHLDAETPQEKRNEYIEQFADGKLMVLSSCNLMCEGFDLSSQIDRDCPVEAVCLLRPTLSVSLYTQQIGRGLRYKPYPAIILDHANNVLRHNLPDQEVDWTLKGRKKKKRGEAEENIPIKTCPICYFVCSASCGSCPDCGHIFEVESRAVKHKEGELNELNVEEIKRQQKIRQGQCETKEDLIAEGKKRGMRYPHKWAEYVLKARADKKKEDVWK